VSSNLYLDALDQKMADSGFEMARDATDFVVLCRSQSEVGAEEVLRLISVWSEQAGLTPHPTKTRIVDSFAFLGYPFRGDRIYPRRESLAKMKGRITELTPRTRPGLIQSVATELNRVLAGWFGYFRHCRWTIYKNLDARMRPRLRRLLLRRHRKNPRRLPCTHRWPDAYFAKAGLFGLREAHLRFAQSTNYQLENRVRENRMHRSEGGDSGSTGLPKPYCDAVAPQLRKQALVFRTTLQRSL